MKGLCKSQAKNIKFEEHKTFLDGFSYPKEWDNYINNHENYLQRVQKSTLSLFDAKRCYETETESKPWN